MPIQLPTSAPQKPPAFLRGQLSGFSTERLMNLLTRRGRDVEITVKPAPRFRRQGRLLVVDLA